MSSPLYPHNPIHSISALARALNEPAGLILQLSRNADDSYRYVPQRKKNGEVRDTYDANEPLKRVQRKIVDRILSKIRYPLYLHGGIKDKEHPRSIISNASQHSGASFLILMDIADFYPSISHEIVECIFNKCLRFSADVSATLAGICCRLGVIPQGASTSSYIANLVFWDTEPKLVESLQQQELTYSRFADDITISSATIIPEHGRTLIISTITKLLALKGLKQKRTKLHIRKKGQAILSDTIAKPLTVTGLTVCGSTPQVSKKERRAIRAAVYEFERLVNLNLPFDEIRPKFNKAMGRVGRLVATKHPDGSALRARLRAAQKIAEHN